MRFFSAPGEGRESVEIARRIVQEARRGVPFDEIAVFVRAPEAYVGLLEHALRRALPDDRGYARAWFDRGTRRPHPAGRAFLAILACACEHLSAGVSRSTSRSRRCHGSTSRHAARPVCRAGG